MSPGDLLPLGLYFTQQLGVMLGVGAMTVMLIAHVVALRDGVVEPAEERFARAVKQVLFFGLLLIIASGVVITAMHSMAGETQIIFQPAFIFKWMLVVVVSLAALSRVGHTFPSLWKEGFVGATWYALFILHVVAPVTSWVDLIIVYAGWVVGFLLVWGAVARVFKPTTAVVGKKVDSAPASVAPKPKVVQSTTKPLPPPVIPKPVVPAPKPAVVVLPPPTPPKPVVPPAPPKPAPPLPPAKPVAAIAPIKPKPSTPVPTKPLEPKPALAVPAKPPTKPQEQVKDPDEHPNLPAIRVMPRTPEDVDRQLRATVVQFS